MQTQTHTTANPATLPPTASLCALADRCMGAAFCNTRNGESRVCARHYRKSESVFRAGSPADQLYFVRGGTLKSYVVTEDGREEVLNFFGAGQVVGVEALFGDKHRTHCDALGSANVCRISMAQFRHQLQHTPQLQDKLMGAFGEEFQQLQQLVHLQHCTATQKVAHFLLQEVRKHARGGPVSREIRLGMSRGDIAQYLVMATETVSRILVRMSRSGILRLRGRNIEILNPAALETAASEAEAA